MIKQICDLATDFSITSGSITVGCDCLSALRTVFIADSDNPGQADYDLVHDLRLYIANSPLTWHWQHILGYQDQTISFGALSPLAKLNVQMDFLAKRYWSIRHPTFTPFHVDSPFACWTLWSGDSRYSRWSRDDLYNDIMSPALQAHWRHRRNIPDTISLDWTAAGEALKTQRLYHRLMIPKWLAGYMPTGQVLQRRGVSDSDACPRCGQPEDTSHIVTCPAPSATLRWRANILSLTRWLRTKHTMPALARLVLYRLTVWRSGSPTLPFTITDPQLAAADLDQATIGWQGLLEGFVSSHWQLAQQSYYSKIGSKVSGHRWVVALIRKGWQISWDMWDHRCAVRSDPASHYIQDEHHNLDLAIQQEFTLGVADWRPSDLRWFRPTRSLLSHESIEYKRQWLSHVQLVRSRNL